MSLELKLKRPMNPGSTALFCDSKQVLYLLPRTKPAQCGSPLEKGGKGSKTTQEACLHTTVGGLQSVDSYITPLLEG